MSRKAVRITMNGVTGRAGCRRRRVRTVLAARGRGRSGGSGTPRPERAFAGRPGPDPAPVPTGPDAVPAGPAAGRCSAVRATAVRRAVVPVGVAAGRHVRRRHPAATGPTGSPRPARPVTAAGGPHHVVQDGPRNRPTRHRRRAPEPIRKPGVRGFRPQWEFFPRHVLPDEPSPRDPAAGAHGAQRAERAVPTEPALGSPTTARRPDVPELTL
ncbi:hypothetical protein ABZ883_14395 [Streptomyces sp. NPDC046977]|uniref:hypothetical protein n=1 Tax=Streptomyces sp. NPDC046977 TaxID=3154703 RepID=UPI0033ED3043